MNEKYKKNILTIIAILFCFFPYLTPASYCMNDLINNSINLWLKLTWLFSIFLFIKNGKISKYTIIFLIFQFTFVIATFFNKNYGSMNNAIYIFLNNCSIFVMADYFIKKNSKLFLKTIGVIFGIMISINLCTMFIYYPRGMYTDILGDRNYYFLEHDNGSFYYAFSILFISIMYNFKKFNKIKLSCILFLVLNIIGYLYVWSTAAYVCLILLLVVLIFYKNKYIVKIVNSKFFLVFLILIFSGVFLFNMYGNLLSDILMFFQKDITMSGRTVIWEKAIILIKANPIIGYGQELLIVRLSKFGISHVHNIVLQILYNGGIIALISYLYFLNLLFKKINKCTDNRIKFIMKATIYIYIFSSFFDYYNTKYIFNFVYICCFNNELLLYEKGDINE